MKLFGKTDTGAVRDNNQDSFRIVTKEKYSLCVVCDGMGGAAGGSTASNTACDTFTEKVFEDICAGASPATFTDVLSDAVNYANNKIYSLAKERHNLSGMGTTLCALLTDGEKTWGVSVGDSRIYMLKNNSLIQMSHDHSYVQILVDSGAITKEESRTHPQKNIITRAVGTNSEVECDSYVTDAGADGYLICSDGLTNYVTDDEIKKVFYEHSGNPEKLADILIDMANTAGGGDNITVIVIVSDKD